MAGSSHNKVDGEVWVEWLEIFDRKMGQAKTEMWGPNGLSWTVSLFCHQ